MTDEPADDAEPTLEERVQALEERVATLAGNLDSALTANEVLQTRYGALIGTVAQLNERVTAVGPGNEA